MIGGILIVVSFIFGIAGYFGIYLEMKEKQIPDPPESSLFWVFACYGGLLHFLIVCFFGGYSPLIILALGFVFIAAPILMYQVSQTMKPKLDISNYHQSAYDFASAYNYFLVVALVCFLVFFD